MKLSKQLIMPVELTEEETKTIEDCRGIIHSALDLLFKYEKNYIGTQEGDERGFFCVSLEDLRHAYATLGILKVPGLKLLDEEYDDA